MARKGKNSQHVNKVTNEQLLESYSAMKRGDMSKKDAIEYLKLTFVDRELKDDDRQAVAEALYRKIFTKNESNPKAEGIIPRAIRRNQLSTAKLEKFEALTAIGTVKELQDKINDQVLMNKLNASAEAQKVSLSEMWRNTVQSMRVQIPKLQAIQAESQSILSFIGVSEDGNYWTPGRAKADGLDDILYSKGDESVPGLGLDTLGQLFASLEDDSDSDE